MPRDPPPLPPPQEAPALRNLALDSLRLDGGGTAQRPGSAPPQVDDDVPPGAAQHPPSHLAASQQRPLAHGVGVGAGLSPLGGDAGPSGHEAGSQHHAGIGTSTLAPRRTLAGAASGGLSALNDALARDTSYLSDPEYVRYYYANRNINPRLPPPSARADWGGSGSTFGKAGDDVSSVVRCWSRLAPNCLPSPPQPRPSPPPPQCAAALYAVCPRASLA
eukprot:349759-Chlamydomonas_euryale.AAC.3